MSDPLPLIALIHPQSATCRHYMACSSSSSSFPSPEMDEHDEVSDDQILQQQQQQPHFNLNSANILVGEAYTGGQDHLLPIAIVGRIMKQALPPNAKISKQAKETVQECASEFISFITAEAAGSCERNNRKTVSGDDICSAMKTLGLDIYADTMRRYLHRYKEHHEEKAAPASSTSIHRLHHGSNARVASINLVDELSVSKSKRSSSSRMRLFPTD